MRTMRCSYSYSRVFDLADIILSMDRFLPVNLIVAIIIEDIPR